MGILLALTVALGFFCLVSNAAWTYRYTRQQLEHQRAGSHPGVIASLRGRKRRAGLRTLVGGLGVAAAFAPVWIWVAMCLTQLVLAVNSVSDWQTSREVSRAVRRQRLEVGGQQS